MTVSHVEPDGADAAYYDTKVNAAARGLYAISHAGSAAGSHSSVATTVKQVSLTNGMGNFGLKSGLLKGKWHMQPLNKDGKFKKLSPPAFTIKRDKDLIKWTGEHGFEVAESMLLEDGTRILLMKESMRRDHLDLLVATWVALVWQTRAQGEYESKPLSAEYCKLC